MLFLAVVVGGFLAAWIFEIYPLRLPRPRPPVFGFEQARTYVEGEDEVERWILAGGTATLEEYHDTHERAR